jgi:hypothetical protein
MKKLLSREEIAAEIGVTPQTIWNLGRAGKIPFYKIKGTLRYDLQEVLNYCSRPAKKTKQKIQAAPKGGDALNISMDNLTTREQAVIDKLLPHFDARNVNQATKMIKYANPEHRELYIQILERLLGYGGHDKQTAYENNMKDYMQKIAHR